MFLACFYFALVRRLFTEHLLVKPQRRSLRLDFQKVSVLIYVRVRNPPDSTRKNHLLDFSTKSFYTSGNSRSGRAKPRKRTLTHCVSNVFFRWAFRMIHEHRFWTLLVTVIVVTAWTRPLSQSFRVYRKTCNHSIVTATVNHFKADLS